MIPYMVGKLAPNSTHFTKRLAKLVPGRSYFRAVLSQNGEKIVTSPLPPPIVERLTCRQRERKAGVGSEERASVLVFLPLDCVGEVSSYMACCSFQIGTGARVDDGNVE